MESLASLLVYAAACASAFAASDEADEDRVINEIAARLGDVKFEF